MLYHVGVNSNRKLFFVHEDSEQVFIGCRKVGRDYECSDLEFFSFTEAKCAAIRIIARKKLGIQKNIDYIRKLKKAAVPLHPKLNKSK